MRIEKGNRYCLWRKKDLYYNCCKNIYVSIHAFVHLAKHDDT